MGTSTRRTLIRRPDERARALVACVSARARALVVWAAALCWLLAAAPAAAQSPRPEEVVRQVGFDQKLDAQVPLDLALRDEDGTAVLLGEYFGEKPVVLTLVYYECPMMCTQVLNGFVRALRALSLEPGRDFEVVTVTIDAREGPALARAKKEHYVAEYGDQDAAAGWHFLSLPGLDRAADDAAIARLADSVGFRYAYYPEVDEFAHASGFVVLTPAGRVSKYFYGVEFTPRDLRLALVESSEGRIGTFADQVLLLCFHYDPTRGEYGFAIMTAIRLLGITTVAAIVGFVAVMLRRERRARALAAGGT